MNWWLFHDRFWYWDSQYCGLPKGKHWWWISEVDMSRRLLSAVGWIPRSIELCFTAQINLFHLITTPNAQPYIYTLYDMYTPSHTRSFSHFRVSLLSILWLLSKHTHSYAFHRLPDLPFFIVSVPIATLKHPLHRQTLPSPNTISSLPNPIPHHRNIPPKPQYSAQKVTKQNKNPIQFHKKPYKSPTHKDQKETEEESSSAFQFLFPSEE